ncbi:zinc finger CW-type PWWP domain protein 1 isoform X2 [Sciurus carolinensis]|uniref:zinc finger CW-type PWWP domain protein 1 isoform X2 n=1 Tax=Sciurus carolinensis TaxID=30640 RepID=UPI001FB2C899|nr:zinc finger CW-type PWWP domain protein 1 isoform X2 [Sciurus carolinensis]
MTTLQKKEECGKGPKKTFAPPTQKLHSMILHGPNSHRDETLGISSPMAEAKPSLPKARLEEEEKATTEDGPGVGQEKKGKAQDSKPSEKKEKGKSSLTNAEFEEIVQIVLQKSLQECLGMGSGLNFAATSCVQTIVHTESDREPGIASATDHDNADGERKMVPHTPEISASIEDELTPELRISKSGQPVPASSEKKFNRLSLSKRKKETQYEKMEKVQGGHECRGKDQSEKMIRGDSQIRGQQKGEESGFGRCLVWVQCSSPNCEKWRRLRGNIDPSILPDNWSCEQNTDLDYNRCDIPEEIWTGRESDVAYASYVPGSIIWAKQYGYPWWPGMVESDPDLGEYFLFASHLDSLPSKYHVTFFGETVSRAWIPVNMLKNFQELSLELAGVKKCRNKDYSQKLVAAIMMAQKAEQTSIGERVNLFGFWSRYSGSDSSGDGKDLMLSGANSPESCLEKEEEESEIEEEKEEKRDPTLPGPKPTKTHSKKSKARRMTDGQDATVKKKIVKRPLGSESMVPPEPIMGRKEGQRTSNLDQPGPKKKFQVPQNKALATTLSQEKEVRMMPKGPTQPAPHGACPLEGKEGLRPQEPPTKEAESIPTEDEASSDLEQLMEDIGGESKEQGEPRHGEDAEGFPAAFFEE